MRVIGYLLLVLVAGVQYRIWVSDDGVPALWRLEKQIGELRRGNVVLAERNRRLAAEVGDLKHGLAAVESRARRELGMIGKGEVLYQFTDR